MNMNPNTEGDTLSFFLFIPNCIALEKFKLIWKMYVGKLLLNKK